MKTRLLLLSVCFFNFIAFSQTHQAYPQDPISDCSNPAGKSSIGDSLAFKKGDSLPYATIYFYRSYIPKMNAPIKKVPLYINDTLVYNLKANTIIGLKVVKEGTYRIAIDDKGESVIPTQIRFGKEYFFKCEVAKGLWFGKPTIETVPPKVGRAESGLLGNEQEKADSR